jgi:hypothetical protein
VVLAVEHVAASGVYRRFAAEAAELVLFLRRLCVLFAAATEPTPSQTAIESVHPEAYAGDREDNKDT